MSKPKKININNVNKFKNDINTWGLDIPLYFHQQQSVLQMEKLEKHRRLCSKNNEHVIHTNLGILGDRTGSGKTLSIISLLSREKNNLNTDSKIFIKSDEELKFSNDVCDDEKILESFENSKNDLIKLIDYPNLKIDINSREVTRYFNELELNNEYFTKTKQYLEKFYYIPVNLVLVSPSIISQWQNELSHTNLKCLFIYRDNHINLYDESFDIIVVSHNRYNDFINHLEILYTERGNIMFKRFIIDEIHFIPRMKKIEASFFWLVSANLYIFNSYTEYQMRTSFLKRLLSSINIKFVTIKNKDDVIDRSYILPPIHEFLYECYSRYRHHRSNFITPEVQRMIDADDLQSAISMLGGESTEHKNLNEIIINKEMEVFHRYSARLRYYEELNDEKQIEIYKKKVEETNISLEKLKERIKNMTNECPVCFEQIINKVVVGCCTNPYCNNCIIQMLKSNLRCALCRSELDPSKMIYSTEEKKDENLIKIKSEKLSKLNQLLEIIKNKPNGKFIVFSEFSNTFVPALNALEENKVSVCELKGSVERINNILNDFKNGELKVLFLNSRYNGSGINLQECTDIIIYHKMDINLEQQIIGRAMRIGRKDPLNIHRLIYTGE